MTNILSIQDLKRTGFAKLKKLFDNEPDIIVQERGRDACVLVELEHYTHLRNCELEIALIKAREEITKDEFVTGTKKHIDKLEKSLSTIKSIHKSASGLKHV